MSARSNSAKAPITDNMRLAMGESSPVKERCSLTNSIRTPLPVRVWTIRRRSSRLRASRSMLWTKTVSPVRTKLKEFQLGAFGVFPGGFVREGLVDLDPLQLPRNLLIKRADADVANAVSKHNVLKSVKIKSITFCQSCQEI